MRIVLRSPVLVSVLVACAVSLAACGGRAEPPDEASTELPPREAEEIPRGLPTYAPEQVADVGTPSALALDGDLVVFTTRETRVSGALVPVGALFLADKRVPPALMISIDKRGATYDALATDGTSAYVATSDGRIVKVSLAGGEEILVTTLDAPAVSIATSGDHVYFARESGEVSRVLKSGGTPEALAKVAGSVRSVTADDASVYVTSAAGGASGGIVRISLATREAKPLAATPGQPCAVVRDARRLFWTTAEAPTKGSVLRVSVDGNDLATVATGSFAACALAADDTNLYFATTAGMPVRSSGGAAAGLGVMRAPVAGGDAVRIGQAAGALTEPGSLAVDATHLYWLTSSGVMRLRKP